MVERGRKLKVFLLLASEGSWRHVRRLLNDITLLLKES